MENIQEGDKIKVGGNKELYYPGPDWNDDMNFWIGKKMTIKRIDRNMFSVQENYWWWVIKDIVGKNYFEDIMKDLRI